MAAASSGRGQGSLSGDTEQLSRVESGCSADRARPNRNARSKRRAACAVAFFDRTELQALGAQHCTGVGNHAPHFKACGIGLVFALPGSGDDEPGSLVHVGHLLLGVAAVIAVGEAIALVRRLRAVRRGR